MSPVHFIHVGFISAVTVTNAASCVIEKTVIKINGSKLNNLKAWTNRGTCMYTPETVALCATF